MLYIGVDLGTSAVKLLLMNEKGDIKKIVSNTSLRLIFSYIVTAINIEIINPTGTTTKA